MKISILSTKVIDQDANDQQETNILIENGIIKAIGAEVFQADVEIKGSSLITSAGWVDMNCNLADPGFEHKETLLTGRAAAASGGFTEILTYPNTHPIIQNKEAIYYLTSRNGQELVHIRPVASLSLDTKGEDLTEILDLHAAGAIAFSDGDQPIKNADLIVRALQYLKKINGLLIVKPEDKSLNKYGVMNEGVQSTMLGMKGMPGLAEELMLERDLRLLEYAGGKIHFIGISTAKSVDLIRTAKNKGLQVTCEIAAHQLAFDDAALGTFDTNFKVNPPFRSKEDNLAIWNGLEDGTIDVIVSAHRPQDIESKKLEFDLADFGIIGLETAFSVISTFNKKASLNNLIRKVSENPRKILGLPMPRISVGEPANITVFDQDQLWVYNEKNIKSRSKNTPFINHSLKGRVVAVINNNQVKLNNIIND